MPRPRLMAFFERARLHGHMRETVSEGGCIRLECMLPSCSHAEQLTVEPGGKGQGIRELRREFVRHLLQAHDYSTATPAPVQRSLLSRTQAVAMLARMPGVVVRTP